MIICDKIFKKYDKLEILNNFSFEFKDNGLYLLFGRSGSGKTTLLNILCGLTDFNNGSVEYTSLNKKYQKSVVNEDVMDIVAYISQNTYFVDYLNIYDNLRLCSDDDALIKKYLKMFDLYHLLEAYPKTLSGGEKQRIAIIQSLLKNKKIFILDEPTASLDKKNKTMVFKILEKLKEKYLIIVSSHDTELKKYADEMIDFNDLSQNLKIKTRVENNKKEYINITKNKNTSNNLLKFMLKNFKYSKFEKRSSIILFFVFFFSILICFICDTPINKLISNIDKNYNVNQLQISCDENNKYLCEQFINDKKYDKQLVLDYWKNLPNHNLPDGSTVEFNYETSIVVLPFEKKFFKLQNSILYGSYFSDINDIIIDLNLAKTMSYDINSLIGKKIKLKLYNGEYEFRICGIFDDFNEKDIKYFNAISYNESSLLNKYFINSLFMEKNFEVTNNEINYDVYFDDFSSMYEMYLKYADSGDTKFIKGLDEQYYSLMKIFLSVSFVLYPLAFMALFISLLFYFQSVMINLENTQYNYCVYNYYGFSLKKIMNSYVITNLVHIIKIIVLALCSALLISNVFNYINDKVNLLQFTLFSFNIYFLLIYIFSIILLTLIVSYILSRKIKKMGWYNMLLESRDLL